MATKTIYKYPLPWGVITMYLPVDAEVLDVQEQDGHLCLWALIDAGQSLTEARTFTVYGTGHPMPEDPGRYISTVVSMDGMLVWHIFESKA